MKDDFIDDCLCVFTARHPSQGGTVVVGWYEHARIYRDAQYLKVPERFFRGEYFGYFATASYEHAVLIPIDERLTFPKVPRGRGGMGQSNVWYAETALGKAYKQEIMNRIHQYQRSRQRMNQREITWQKDVEKRKQVEKRAIYWITSLYEARGYSVSSVELENRGWDLEARVGDEKLTLEVKGLSGCEPMVQLTPNEYSKMKHPDFRRHYRLCIVTNVLEDPTHWIFSYSQELAGWYSEANEPLQIEEITSVKCYI